jgi:hypothetical protein
MHLLGQRKLILLLSCHLVVKDCACLYISSYHVYISSLMHSCYLLCAYACNRITGGSHSSGIRSQERGGPARDPAVGGSRRRRTSAGGTSRVPRS